MALPGLNERERRILEAVIQTYVETAQPAGSRSLAHKFGLGVSPATIRNTMSDLEEKGYLFHPHASAGPVRTIFVDVHGEIADAAIAEVTRVLNDRLAGLTLRQIRSSLGDRLRDVGPTREASDLLNVFIEEGDQLFDSALESSDDSVLLGQASVLAEQPEFSTIDNMRKLVALTETREKLGELLRRRSETGGVSITIGNEHNDPRLASFTVVTASYHAGPLSGVIGVIGPTRMPYDKVISLVTHASELVTDLLKENSRGHG